MRRRSLRGCLSLGPGPRGWPQNTQGSAPRPRARSPARQLLPLTFSVSILILSQWLKLMRLALSPVAPTLQIREKMNQGSISSGTRLSFAGGIFLMPWGQSGQHRAKARAVLSGLRKPGGGAHPLVSAAVLCLQQTGQGGPAAHVSPSDSVFQKAGPGFRARR